MYERVALITGSTSGIGAATARRLARDGYQVALQSRRSADVGMRMAAELAGASYHQADLGDEQAMRGLVAAVLRRHGRLDVLINNAGESIRIPHADLKAATPAARAKPLAAAIAGSRTVMVPDSGHFMMVERPDESLEALKASV